MAIKQNFTRFVGVVAVAVVAQASVIAPAAAQNADNCVCIVGAGTVGKVTSASGPVTLNGKTGPVDAIVEAPLSVGSVLRTGTAGSAGAMVGEGCNVNIAALSQMSIVALDANRMCVRLTGKAPGMPIPATTMAVVGGGVALGGGVVLLGLGQDDPVSQ
jgi:hypothetical protein